MANGTADFTIGKGDRLPDLVVTPKTAAGTIVDVSGKSAKFFIEGVEHSASIFQDTDNIYKLRYTWPANDTNTAGWYRCYFLVDYGSSITERFPNDDIILVQVFDPPTNAGRIITSPEELNDIRAFMGLDPVDFTDPAIKGLMFLGASELVIRKAVNEMSVKTNGAVPTVTQILASPPTLPATDDDLLALKMAVAAYVTVQFQPGATNAINTSITVGKQTVDRGGTGDSWKNVMEIAFAQAGMYLQLITGWPDQSQTTMMLSGPTSSGARPDTVSGFWIY
jgi:hypothetical protein